MRRSLAARKFSWLAGQEERPWLSAGWAALALALAVRAQAALDSDARYWLDVLLLYLVAVGAWWLALRHQPLAADGLTPLVPGPVMDRRRWQAAVGGIGLVLFTAVLMPALARSNLPVVGSLAERLAILRYPFGLNNDTNTLTLPGVVFWLTGCLLFLWAVAEPVALSWRERFWKNGTLVVQIGAPTLALLAIMALGAWVRFYDLPSLPLEMTSDHVEKLLDVQDVLAGHRPVYLPRNAGREPLEFYWLALLVRLGLPFGFITLKIGMALVSLLTVPLVYWLGRRSWGTEVGLFSALALALSPWHLQISRAGLRIGFAPLFVALCLGFLMWALASGKRNAWLATGVTLGAGMYGYSAFRSMAFLVALAVVLKLGWDAIQRRRRMRRKAGSESATVGGVRPLLEHVVWAAVAAVLVAAPLIRFALDQPRTFWGRTITRVTGAEVALQHPPLVQLALNWRQALLMFNATSDSAWFQSPPGRPALETVTGALFVLGVVMALRAVFCRRWREPLVLLAIPVMLVSSVLALAFPNEVPHLARASGALPAAMLLVALPLVAVWNLWRRAFGAYGSLAALAAFAVLFVWAGRNTVQRYFVEYRQAYNQATHPTSEGARLARGFVDLGGDRDHVYLVGWAHGWDYRAFGAQMGDLNWNGLLWGSAADGSDSVAGAANHVDDPAAKLYFVGGDYAAAHLDFLRHLYPQSLVAEHHSATTGKTYWTVYVPARKGDGESD